MFNGKFVTPVIVKVFYFIGVLGIPVAVLSGNMIVNQFLNFNVSGSIALISIIGLELAWLVICECAILLFSIFAELSTISKTLQTNKTHNE